MSKLLSVLIALVFVTEAKPCDICGCGVGGNYIGILPEFRTTIFGVRYRYNALRTHIGAAGQATYLTTSETYKTAELWGGWNIGKRWRIMASVPYSFNERYNQGISNTKNGIGDISLTGFYQLLNKRDIFDSSKLLIQSLWVGGGLKLATGKYNPADKSSSTENTNLFQLGTRSTDFTINAMYDIRLQDAGLNVYANYKMNTANKYHYNYGNKLNTSAQLYFKFNIKNKVTIAPNAGVSYEISKHDIDNKFIVDITGGRLLSGTLGVETALRKITIGANWQTPLSQRLANGFVKAKNRMMAHISFIL